LYTARNFTLSRQAYRLTGQGQVTDRYARAIEQLSSGKLDVRIGGIYALERMAADSARDHQTVMDRPGGVHPGALTRAMACSGIRRFSCA
jgi:hypothetical protein